MRRDLNNYNLEMAENFSRMGNRKESMGNKIESLVRSGCVQVEICSSKIGKNYEFMNPVSGGQRLFARCARSPCRAQALAGATDPAADAW